MVKQDPSLTGPAELVQHLRHHLQALENALKEIDQRSQQRMQQLQQRLNQIGALNDVLVNLHNEIAAIASTSPSQDQLDRLITHIRQVNDQINIEDSQTLVREVEGMIDMIRQRNQLADDMKRPLGDMLVNKQYGKAFAPFSIGAAAISLLLLMLCPMLGASGGDAFGWVLIALFLGYIGFFARSFLRS